MPSRLMCHSCLAPHGVQVVYFGDSMRSDMFPASSYGKFETVMIVEEMEGEGVPGGGRSGGGGDSSVQAKSGEAPAEPLEKKGKYEVSPPTQTAVSA